jgi:two-component system nitrogen regulation response regulator NtrX
MNAVERVLIMAPGDTVGAADLPAGMGLALTPGQTAVPEGTLAVRHDGATLQQFKEDAERSYLVTKLRDQEWNIAATAKAIDTPRSNLYKKLETYSIDKEKDGKP